MKNQNGLRLRYFQKTLFFFSLCFSVSAFSSPVTIGDAARHALHSNPQVFERLSAVNSSHYLVNQAYSSYFPQVNITSGAGRSYTKNASTGFMGLRLTPTDASVDTQEILFDGGNRYYTVKERKAVLGTSKESYREIRETVAFDASNAYLNLLRTRRIVGILRKDVGSLKKMQVKVELRLEGGPGRVSEVQLTKSRLAAAYARLQEAISNFEQAEYEYQRIVGIMPPHRAQDFKDPGLPIPLELHIPTAVHLAIDQNPTLAARREEVAASAARVKVDRSAFFPTISFNAIASHGNNIGGIRGIDNETLAEVRLNYNIFAGGSDLNQVRSDVAQLQGFKYAYANEERTIIQGVKQAIAIIINNDIAIPQLRQHVIQSYNVFKSYEEEFELGYRSLFDTLNAQREYFNADILLTDAIFERDSAAYQLKAFFGELANYYDECHDRLNQWDKITW